MELKSSLCYIEPHVFDFNDPVLTDDYKIVKASKLLFNPSRFDLIIKYLYASARLGIAQEQGDIHWLRELFVEQRRYLNNFHESNYPEFSTGEQFIHGFDRLIEICSKSEDQRISTIPVYEDLTPIDGAHRISILAALGKDVTLVPFRKKYPRTNYNYDYRFFRLKGMPLEYTDYAALEYVRHAPNVYAICLFPSCKDKWEEIDVMIRNELVVYYDKKIALTEIGKINFIRNLYRTEPWVGSIIDDFKGARWKKEQCFSKDGGIRVYMVVSESLEKVVALKQQIRNYCQLGNHSIHSTDIKSATFEMASMTLHAPTTSFLNSVEANEFPIFNKLFPNYQQYLNSFQLDRNHFCIDGSAILSACGLRDCRDLDFLSSEEERSLPFSPTDVDCHNDYIQANGFDKLLNLSIKSIVLNPRHYFFFEGYKVMSPRLLYIIKTFRNEPKDLVDSILLKEILTRIEGSKALLSSADIEMQSDPIWYGHLDSFLRENGYYLLSGLLNTKLIITERVRCLISKWEEFNGITNCFSTDEFTYFFELFHQLPFANNAVFWSTLAHYSKSLSEDDEDTYVDIIILICICFIEFSRQNDTFLFMPSFSAFTKLPSISENELIVKFLKKS